MSRGRDHRPHKTREQLDAKRKARVIKKPEEIVDDIIVFGISERDNRPKTKPLKKTYFIAVEGEVTEKLYFDHLAKKISIISRYSPIIKIETIPPENGESAPNKVLANITRRIKNTRHRRIMIEEDEAWIVIDRDRADGEQLFQCHKWSGKKVRYGFALSNPKFEYWLLLHFKNPDPDGVTKDNIDELVKDTGKIGDTKNSNGSFLRNIDISNIKLATQNAKARDTPPCQKWPEKTGTTVYRLVENILKSTPTE